MKPDVVSGVSVCVDWNRLRRSHFIIGTLWTAAVLIFQLGSRGDRLVVAAAWLALVLLPVERYLQSFLPFMPLTGIVETDSYYREIHLPSICMLQPGQSATMKRGMPLIQVIPIKRERWGMSTCRQDQEKRRAAEQPFTADRHHYKEAIWKKLEYS